MTQDGVLRLRKARNFTNINRINKDILQNKRADYGKRIIPALSTQLEERFGRNFTVLPPVTLRLQLRGHHFLLQVLPERLHL